MFFPEQTTNESGNMETRKSGKLYCHDPVLNQKDPQSFTLTTTKLYFTDLPEEEEENDEPLDPVICSGGSATGANLATWVLDLP